MTSLPSGFHLPGVHGTLLGIASLAITDIQAGLILTRW